MKIRKYIVDAIVTHGSQPVRFPPTRELGRKFGVSQPTALRAVKDLIAEGYLEACRGGGTVSRPRLFQGMDLKIVGMIASLGRQSFDNYFFMELEFLVGMELMRRSDRYCTQNLLLETPSMLERTIQENSISGLVLLDSLDPIPEFALNARKNGLPVVSFFQLAEGISSFYVSLEERFRDILRLLFREKRTNILIIGWNRSEMVDSAQSGIEQACREFDVPASQVTLICEEAKVACDRVHALLDSGVKFDAAVFYPCYRSIYDLLCERLDTREACRFILDPSAVFDDMRYTGYALRYDLKTAARKLVDHLLEQMERPDTPVIRETIAYTIDFYREGTIC